MNQQLPYPARHPDTKPLSVHDSKHLHRLNPRPAQADVLGLVQSLQTTLELEGLIGLFAEAAGAVTPFDGLRYERPEQAIDCLQGRQARHQCAYNLDVNGQGLGRMLFYRDRRFAEAEMASLENLLSLLVYPIRNALQYRDALLSASLDPLTGLSNRGALDTVFARELSLAQRHERALTLLVIDIDHFKRVNDEHGHAIGDEVLRHVAQIVQDQTRETDRAFRFGGEEFVIILPETPEDGGAILAQRILRRIEKRPLVRDGEPDLNITVSIGVATLRREDDTQSLFGRADQSLYAAKRGGRNQIRVA